MCKPSVKHICAGLVEPKIENVLPTAARSKFLKGQNGHEDSTEELQLSEPDRPGGGMGRVNPPPRRLVWRFLLRFGGFGAGSKPLHA